MTVKEEILALVNKLPDDVTLEEVQYRLYILEKIRSGEESLKRGERLSQQQVEAHFEEWLRE